MKTIRVGKITNWVIGFGVGFALIDQLSKFFVQYYTKIPVHTNTGVAFSIQLPISAQMIVSVALLIAILLFSKSIIDSLKSHKFASIIALGMIFGGGLGNLIDRIRLGHVIDFIDLKIWPVFNLGDSFITIGAIFLAIMLFKK